MSGFVPYGGQRGFRAGLVGGSEDAAGPSTDPTGVDAAVSQSSDVTDEPVTPSLPQTLEELAILETEAEERGWKGAEAALASERADAEADRSAVSRVLDAVESARREWSNEVRNTLGEMVVVGVRQVVSESAELQKEILRDRMAEVGERMIGERTVVVRVRPEDEEMAVALVGGREGWQVVPDSAISAGVIAETRSGKIDATLGSAVAGLASSVKEWQDEEAGEE